MVGSIGRGAGIGALSNGVSNMCVTTIDYLAEHGNLNGALDDIAISGFSGVLSGGIIGGISGGLQFKINDFHSGLENTNNKNFVDSMSPEDASRYDEFWKNNESFYHLCNKKIPISLLIRQNPCHVCSYSLFDKVVLIKKTNNMEVNNY